MPSLRRLPLVGCSLALLGGALAMLEKTDEPRPIFSSELSACAPVRKLNAIKAALEAEEGESLSERAFSTLFPFADPGHNALMATFYISSVPNLLLAAMPADINPQSLRLLSVFAVGTLFGDIALHLLPHSFLGEPPIDGGVQVVVVEPKRNVVISLAIFAGFASFFLFERFARFVSADSSDEPANGHTHGHSHTAATGSSSSVEFIKSTGELRKRGGSKEVATVVPEPQPTEPAKSKAVGAVLNLVADATHNCVDALTVVAAFYASPVLGASTAVACFAHEVPHQVADLSMLRASGFSKSQAIGAQLATGLCAFAGTFLGIWAHRSAVAGATEAETDLVVSLLGRSTGFLGTSATAADLVIPAVTGAFIYIATVSSVPDLLAGRTTGSQLVKETIALGVGVGIMGLLSWYE